MKCNYLIKIDGKSYTLAENIESGQVKDIDDLLKLLRNKDMNVLTEIKDSIKIIESVEELNLNNINENSVGLYSPTELLNSAFTEDSDRNLFNKLKISTTQKERKIVIAGFGDENIKTQFYKDHIFLNLNYMYDSDNKIMALVEYALYLFDPDNYTTNSKVLETNISSPISETLLESLIKSNKTEEVKKLISKIQLTYQKVKMKLGSDIAERNLSTLRENLAQVWDQSVELKQDTDVNFLPKTSIPVENLKQGDLVLVPVMSASGATKYTKGVYETFYDSYIDTNGQAVLRTITINSYGIPETRKRLAQKYVTDADGKTTIKNSSTVDARVLDQSEYREYSYDSDTKYISIKTTMTKGYVGYESLLNMLKNPQSKVIMGENSYKIKKIQGSSVTLENGKVVNITKIEAINYPLTKMNIFPSLPEVGLDAPNSIWSKDTHPIIGEHIAFKKAPKDNFLTEGIVIGFGVHNDDKIVYYITASGKTTKSGYIKESNVRFVSKPPTKFHISVLEQSNIDSTIKTLYLKPDGSFKNITNEMAANKKGEFRDSEYSIQELNRYIPLLPGDILYNKMVKATFKVVHSSTNTVKTVMMGNNGPQYFTVSKDNIEDYLLLTKRPINESFALANIRKNRYNYSKDSGSKSIEVTIWQNPNGFVYSLPKNMSEVNRKSHSLYERSTDNLRGPVDITKQMIVELATRYKWASLPTTLYTSINENTNNLVKDSDNTVRIGVTDALTKQIFNQKQILQSYIVPGSYITFNNNNAKAFIVEKVYKDKILVAYYHYTNKQNLNIGNPDLQYVKAEKFFVDLNSLENITVDPSKENQSKITNLYLPKWASAAFDQITSLKAIDTKNFNKQSKLNKYSASDSPEIIMSVITLMQSRFGIPITVIHNSDVAQFNNPDIVNAAAFVTKEGLYINIDQASIEEPLHEMLHLVLANLKYSDPDTYYRLVNSVQYHPLFEEVYSRYTDINSEVLEETFIKLLSQTFRHNILKEGVYTDASFNRAIKSSIHDMMGLTESLDWEDSFDLLGKSMNDILFDFGSSLTQNSESLINTDNINYMFDISQEIKILIDSDKLKQKCSY